MESTSESIGSSEVMVLNEQSEDRLTLQLEAAENVSDKRSPSSPMDSDMEATEDRVSLKVEILDFLVKNKQAHFKSQQRGDPDLSIEEKRVIAGDLFDKSLSGFLSRFGLLLSKTHLEHFHNFEYRDDKERDEVEYHLSYLGASSSKSSKTKTKNRRYDALQKMIQSGSYFSMDEMQARNPLLFEQLVGRYQPDDEKQPNEDELPTEGELPWMQHFAKRVEIERMEKFKEQQKLDEAGDEDDSSDEADKVIPKKEEEDSINLWGEYRGKFHTDNSSQKKKKKSVKKERNLNFQNVSDEEKAFYLQEFQNAMYHSFLSGNDKDFDYSSVDNNSEYDCVDMRERDEQDQYFDEESPDSISQADVDMSENSKDEFAEFCEAPAANVTAATVGAMEQEEEELDDISDRLTQDDVENLKSFASSWAENHNCPISGQERTLNSIKSVELDVTDKSVLHKVPVKKNHKIKINLKTKEI